MWVLRRSLAYGLRQLHETHWAKYLVFRGIEYSRKGLYAAAIEQYDAALSSVPNYVDGLVARGAAKANLVSTVSVSESSSRNH